MIVRVRSICHMRQRREGESHGYVDVVLVNSTPTSAPVESCPASSLLLLL